MNTNNKTTQLAIQLSRPMSTMTPAILKDARNHLNLLNDELVKAQAELDRTKRALIDQAQQAQWWQDKNAVVSQRLMKCESDLAKNGGSRLTIGMVVGFVLGFAFFALVSVSVK